MVLARGLVPLIILGLMVYCVLDIIATDDSRVRNLPKLPWLFIVILIPTIGAIAWLLLGRPEGAGFALGGAAPRRGYNPQPDPYPNRFALPDDKPVLESREEAIRRWQEEKRRREQEIEELERALSAGDGPPEPILEPEPSEPDDEPDDPPAEGS